MATLSPSDPNTEQTASRYEPLPQAPLPHAAGRGPLLICLPSMPAEVAQAVLVHIARSFPAEPVLVASPDQDTEEPATNGLPHRVPFAEPHVGGDWILNAADYTAGAQTAAARHATDVLLLGPEAQTLEPEVLRGLRDALHAGADLVLPRYRMPADDGLVNSAMLYPLTRALFGADIRFPLPLDAAFSARMANRLRVAGKLAAQAPEGLLWPVAEACVAGLTVQQVEGGARALPQPQEADLHDLFNTVTGSLFADLEAKATFWQRARVVPARPVMATPQTTATPSREAVEEVRGLTEGFRLAFTNLREIWSLVLPPQSLLALKKLSGTTAENFQFPPSLWARTVYDFALAFHLRTLNRGHLLGALMPLYLAWVAGFLRTGHDPAHAAHTLEATALAFEQEKPYLVSRWRWPDRFNP